MTVRLILVATPIGNLADLSPRAELALREADVWLVEDSRVSARLQGHLGLKKPMRVVNEHTTTAQLERHLSELSAGRTAALLTDGGNPTISDPGAMVADHCYMGGIRVEAVPGPSAVTTALMLSGFFAQRFAFLGFLGRKPGAIRSELESFKDSPYTLVLFESPFRVDRTLAVAAEALGPRRYAICREMTKAFEQVFRGRLPAIPTVEEVPRKGEFTIVFEGRRKADPSGV